MMERNKKVEYSNLTISKSVNGVEPLINQFAR